MVAAGGFASLSGGCLEYTREKNFCKLIYSIIISTSRVNEDINMKNDLIINSGMRVYGMEFQR